VPQAAALRCCRRTSLQAEKRHPPIDVSFLIFSARKAAEGGIETGRGPLNALTRIALDKHQADARKFVQLAAQRQLAFWTELMDSTPELSRCVPPQLRLL